VLCCSCACVLDELVKLGVVLGKEIVGNFHLEKMTRNLIAGGIGFVINIVVCIAEVTVKSGKSFRNGIIAGNFFTDSASALCLCCKNAMSCFALSLIEDTVIGYRLAGDVI